MAESAAPELPAHYPLKAWPERGGALLRLRLARPKANIVDAEMIAALRSALDAFDGSPGLRGVLLDAEGPHFSLAPASRSTWPTAARRCSPACTRC